MAILRAGEREKIVPDGQSVILPAEELGVPFGCTAGNCGTCITVVAEGMEFLSPRSAQEVDFRLEARERLLCQCRILGGTVVLDL